MCIVISYSNNKGTLITTEEELSKYKQHLNSIYNNNSISVNNTLAFLHAGNLLCILEFNRWKDWKKLNKPKE